MEVRLETGKPIGRLAIEQARNNKKLNQGSGREMEREDRMEEKEQIGMPSSATWWRGVGAR